MDNVIITGLRGVGKTVLLETLKPIAIQNGWLWAGTDLSESASISEEHLAVRILADLSVVSSSMTMTMQTREGMGFLARREETPLTLTYQTLSQIYAQTPGLVGDKLKSCLETIWHVSRRQLIFAYDEAQNLADHAIKDQYPLSLLLDVFQSLQRKEIPFMLVLSGLPTLFPKLVESRTYAERMFHVIFLNQLDNNAARQAITTPLLAANGGIQFPESDVETIISLSGGYPYFIQFISREVYDLIATGNSTIPYDAIMRKLDTDFFSGRWARATDRQRELLTVAARLENADEEFAVQELVAGAKNLTKPFSSSHVNQMLSSLIHAGLIYKNRHGRYSFAVPLMSQFIRRNAADA
ncbi:MAG: hypothetical protein OEL53_04920 [Rhodospirillales bacterium]|nr:hypothetical protein [Rhodospirillales bacterium]